MRTSQFYVFRRPSTRNVYNDRISIFFAITPLNGGLEEAGRRGAFDGEEVEGGAWVTKKGGAARCGTSGGGSQEGRRCVCDSRYMCILANPFCTNDRRDLAHDASSRSEHGLVYSYQSIPPFPPAVISFAAFTSPAPSLK